MTICSVRIHFAHPTQHVLAVCYSPDGSHIAVAGQMLSTSEGLGFVSIYDIAATPELLQTHSQAQAIHCLAWSPDGTLLASGGNDGLVSLWHVDAAQTPPLLYREHSPEVGRVPERCSPRRHTILAIAWPDENTVLSVGREGHILSWDAHSAETRQRAYGNADTTCLAFSPRQRLLALFTPLRAYPPSGQVQVWDRAAQTIIHTLNLPGNRLETVHVYAMAWAPDETRLALRTEDLVQIWDMRTLTAPRLLNTWRIAEAMHSSSPHLAWNPRGTALACIVAHRSASTAIVEVRDAACGEVLAAFPTYHPLSLAWSPDGTHLAVGEEDALAFYTLPSTVSSTSERPAAGEPMQH